MTHYTLNTGDSIESPRSGVSDDAARVLSNLVDGGQLPGPFAAFRVEVVRGVGGAVFTVMRGREGLVTCGVAWTAAGAEEVWPAIEGLYLDLGDRPELVAPGRLAVRPETIPWLSVVVLPGIVMCASEFFGWLGDFERCLGWAIIERGKGHNGR